MLGVLLLIIASDVYSSPMPGANPERDTVYLKKGFILKFDHQIIQALHDTVFIIPDSTHYEILPGKFEKSKQFYDTLKARAEKKKLTRELYKLAFRPPSKSMMPDTLQIEKSEEPYIPYQGKIVNKIIYQKLDVFGPTITDTSRKAITWLGETANRLHIDTRTFVIRDNLLFKQGDTVNAIIFANNERILRELPFIDNARIELIEGPGDSVNVLIVTKDYFPYGVSFKAVSIHKARLGIWDENVAGLGHNISVRTTLHSDESPFIRFSNGEYRVSNIAGSFVRGRLYYDRNDLNREYGIFLSRSSIPYKIKYSGGIGIWRSVSLPEDQSSMAEDVHERIEYNVWDTYLGRDFMLHDPAEAQTSDNFLTFMGRLTKRSFLYRPYVSADSNRYYYNSTRLLGSLGISKNDYFTSNYVFYFGRTEDIPYGHKINLTYGYEWREFYNRSYLGLSLAAGDYLRNIGYLYGSFDIGGFFHDRIYEDGALNGRIFYATRFFQAGRTKIRNFLIADYTLGLNRPGYDFIALKDGFGLLDVSSEFLKGSQRAYFSAQSVAFLPFYFYGFRFSVFTFADLAFLGPDDYPVFANPAYSAIGFGFRMKNENLVLNALEIRFAFYPRMLPDGETYNISLAGEKVLGFRDFRIGVPGVVGFR